MEVARAIRLLFSCCESLRLYPTSIDSYLLRTIDMQTTLITQRRLLYACDDRSVSEARGKRLLAFTALHIHAFAAALLGEDRAMRDRRLTFDEGIDTIREVAGSEATWLFLFERRFDLRADRLRDRATCVETTAARWVDRARHITSEQDALTANSGVRNRGSREQRGGVWVQRHVVQLARRSHLDELAEVHDADTVADIFDDWQIVGDEEVSQAKLGLQLFQQVENL